MCPSMNCKIKTNLILLNKLKKYFSCLTVRAIVKKSFTTPINTKQKDPILSYFSLKTKKK